MANHDQTKSSASFPRYTVRSLLVVMAGVSLLSAPMAWIGPSYGFYVGAVTLVFAWVATQLHRKSTSHAMIACVVSGMLAFFPGFVFVFLVALVMFLVVWATVLLPDRSGIRISLCFVVTLAGVWLPFADRYRAVRQIDSMRADYPFVSVRDRLPAAPAVLDQQQLELPESLEANLVAFEKRRRRSGREWALERLHEESYRLFVSSPGFGMSRMRRVTPRSLELQPVDQKPLPAYFAAKGDWNEDAHEVHGSALIDFFDADSMGFVRSVDKVAGFESHAFRQIGGSEGLDRLAASDKDAGSLQLDRIE
ncbi:MAG: hypothetical protein ACR2NU_02185, partial [Aeoliella sp.]